MAAVHSVHNILRVSGFLSFSHVDNLPLVGQNEEPGWVHTLVDNLKVLLAQRMGRREYVQIWMDRRLKPNEPFPPEIEQAVKGSALLLLIISEGVGRL